MSHPHRYDEELTWLNTWMAALAAAGQTWFGPTELN